MRHHHVAERPGRLVETDPLAQGECFRHVDLHVVDEVAVPDRLEQAVGKAERQDVLRRLLAEEMVDPENLALVEHLVQLGVQHHGARQIGAERLFHDDAGPFDQPGRAEQPHRWQRGARRHAEIMDAPAFAAQQPFGTLNRRLQYLRPGGHGDIVQRRREGRPVIFLDLAAGELVQRLPREGAEAVGVHVVQRDADDPAAGDEATARQVEHARQQLAPGQVAGGAHQGDKLRILWTNAERNLAHVYPANDAPRRADARSYPELVSQALRSRLARMAARPWATLWRTSRRSRRFGPPWISPEGQSFKPIRSRAKLPSCPKRHRAAPPGPARASIPGTADGRRRRR